MIKGKEYSVPIPNAGAKEDFYLLKKALKGDQDAREMLLGKEEVRWLFIGDIGIVRWVKLTKNDVEIKEYK